MTAASVMIQHSPATIRKRRTILFEVVHPKHFLQFRHAIDVLKMEHQVYVAARDKDVTLQLLQEHEVEFFSYGKTPPGLHRKLLALPRHMVTYAGLLRRLRPDFIISKCSPFGATLAHIVGAKTIVMPDGEGRMLAERFVIPRSDHVVTPLSLERDFGAKHRRVNGFFESGYLHPKYFRPDESIRDILHLQPGERFAIVRFASYGAYHDIGKSGIESHDMVRLVGELAKRLKVFVSAEGDIPEALDVHRLRIPVSRIHDTLRYASVYVGDSGTMATEAALLGTPAIRCSSLVDGLDLSNFRNLENRYQLLYNFSSFDAALRRALEIVQDPDAKRVWTERSERYFETVGDVNAEMLGILREIVESD